MRKTLACVLLLACVSVCAAKDDKTKGAVKSRPDLSGTWGRDKSKSDFGMLASSPAAKADETLTITQNEPEIKITRTLSLNGREEVQALVYYTDGRGETNPSTLGRIGVKSKTKWDGGKLVSESKLTHESPRGGTFSIDSTEKWQLSSDGKTLTQTNIIVTPRGVQTVRQVFNRRS
ncbi:MAG: hypothetical protein LC754_06655 [Acidobacteria bacterium]|nr:hypothetical protein [Acidobacteriota bacterium]